MAVEDDCDEPLGASSVPAGIRVYRLVPYHLSFFHDRAGGVAYRAREGYENDQNMLLLERSA